jgi:cell division protein FtsZ
VRFKMSKASRASQSKRKAKAGKPAKRKRKTTKPTKRTGTKSHPRMPIEGLPDAREMKLEFEFEPQERAKIRVVGVGGAGGNAVNRMIESGFTGVDFVAINTDAQALDASLAQNRIQIGKKLTHGLGSGGDPDVGRKAIEEDKEQVAAAVNGADMVFVTGGMGGGTGTGAGPVVAKLAKDAGALVVAVATKPFLFEGQYRMRQAIEGLEVLKQESDTAIVIPNQRLLAVASKNTPIREAFRIADDILLRATRGVSDLITVPGLVNLDFADVRSVMTEKGDAVMGTGVSSGENRAVESAQQAISSPLLEDTSIAGSSGVLVNVTGGGDLTLYEINEAAMVINDAIGAETNMIFGAVIDEELKDQIMITVIATGILAEGRTRHAGERPAARPARTAKAAGTSRRHDVEVPPHRRPEPVHSPVLRAKGARRHSRRDLEIPAFLRRQMD